MALRGPRATCPRSMTAPPLWRDRLARKVVASPAVGTVNCLAGEQLDADRHGRDAAERFLAVSLSRRQRSRRSLPCWRSLAGNSQAPRSTGASRVDLPTG